MLRPSSQQVDVSGIDELLDRFDGTEPILAVMVPVDEIPIRAEDGERLVLVIDLFGLERLHRAMAGPAIVLRPDDGSVIGRIAGLSVCCGKIGF